MPAMATSPKSLKLGFQRNYYSRVSFGNNAQEVDPRFTNLPDNELLDGKPKQLNGNLQPPLGLGHINFGMEDQMEVQGYVRDRVRTTICWLLIVVTLGTLRLVFHWWPHWMLFATHRPSSLDVAEKVLIIERYQQKHKCYYVKNIKVISSEFARSSYEDDDNKIWDQQCLMEMEQIQSTKLSVHCSGGQFKEVDSVRMFSCKKMQYVWDPELNEFYKLRGLDQKVPLSTLHLQKGLSITEQFFRRAVFGANKILVPMRSVLALLCLEVLNPFYIFQIFSFTLWIVDGYVYYALAILAMSSCSIAVAVIQTRRNQINLWSRVHSRDVATVVRRGCDADHEVTTIPTEHLVPGDLLVLPSHGCVMHCDAVLLTGNCIVNESMLTGESVPVTKTPLPSSSSIFYDEKEHARHTLFCGTQVIQTRYYGSERVYAVVIRTSFSTAKGSLVRSILYPPPVDFKFERDSYKFVQLLASVAALGVLYTIVTKAMRELPWGEITVEALDLITIVVPPALPAAMTVGRMYAQSRLEKANVFCISPRTINVSGSINCVCFDKTGTLTEDGLDMWGVVPVNCSKFDPPVIEIQSLPLDPLLKAMVTCHSITVIDGCLAGDPLDIKMFESTGWTLEEPGVSDAAKFDLISPTVVKPAFYNMSDDLNELALEIGIVRQFPFSSSLQRMSVVTRQLGAGEFTLYTKGSPEMILSLCNPKTVPIDFERKLEKYTKAGYRVLGMGYKDLPAKLSYAKMMRLAREDAETNLTFLGLVVMENRLKPQTTGVLNTLRNANIRTVMITGDNMLTALSVARDCGIVSYNERVVMVHTGETPGGQPHIYFTQCSGTSSPDNLQTYNEVSQTLVMMESIASLQTLESLAANGNLQNIQTPNNTNIIVEEVGEEVDYSFALTGSTWTTIRSHFPELTQKIVARGAVFARMSPDHKQQLIQELQNLGYFVAMVGDGANDCGALKAAHAGISLSEAESSVASPFTSREANISCIVEVIKEGRAALVTSFAIFKYMAAYSLMQFASVIILYSIDTNLTDIEFLYIDLFVITTFAFVLGRVEAFKGPLYPQPPQSSLISLAPILSLVFQMAVAIGTQVFSFHIVQQYDWYTPFNRTKYEEGEGGAGFENYSVFAVSSLQYIILALVFSKGAPYRASLLTSPGLILATIVITCFNLYLTIDPSPVLVSSFEISLPQDIHFRCLMAVIGAVNLFLAIVSEFIVGYLQYFISRLKGRELHLYEMINRELKERFDWPPITSEPVVKETHFSTSRHPPTVVSVVQTPLNKKRLNSIGNLSGSDLHLDDLRYSTPMKSIQSLFEKRGVNQSEDSLSGYLTPPTSFGLSPPSTPFHQN